MNSLARLVVLYGTGGLSDVGRHAVQAALERSDVESIKVLTQHPQLLEESNWQCGCEKPHEFSEQDRQRFEVIPVKSWKDDDLGSHFAGATAVVSCLGNRQPFIGGYVANEGNQAVIKAMKANKVTRAVVISSSGIEEDWPPMEFFWGGKILALTFFTISRQAFQDLTMMERAYRNSELDYLLVRPVGIGEDVVPVGEWYLQREKHEDVLSCNMAKLDLARFMVEEAINPSKHAEAVVVGAKSPSTNT
jgi:nucleoside-diphosphate-sugar epimerase